VRLISQILNPSLLSRTLSMILYILNEFMSAGFATRCQWHSLHWSTADYLNSWADDATSFLVPRKDLVEKNLNTREEQARNLCMLAAKTFRVMRT
jgi:hypothetical protein